MSLEDETENGREQQQEGEDREETPICDQDGGIAGSMIGDVSQYRDRYCQRWMAALKPIEGLDWRQWVHVRVLLWRREVCSVLPADPHGAATDPTQSRWPPERAPARPACAKPYSRSSA